MPYPATQLITRSWYLSGIVARDEEDVSGDQMNDGLEMLNSVLAIKAADQRMIPYYNDVDFLGVVGQEKYFIENLLLVESLTFTISTVRYSMIPEPRRQYFASPRANDILSLPFQYHVERTLGGSNIYMYFQPQDPYPFKVWGKFALLKVNSLLQDLSLTLDQFYIEYLRYALAQYMCQEYNIMFSPENRDALMSLENTIFDISPIDFTMSKLSFFTGSGGTDIYAQVNIGKSMTPG